MQPQELHLVVHVLVTALQSRRPVPLRSLAPLRKKKGGGEEGMKKIDVEKLLGFLEGGVEIVACFLVFIPSGTSQVIPAENEVLQKQPKPSKLTR